jgi:hypothetical protein
MSMFIARSLPLIKYFDDWIARCDKGGWQAQSRAEVGMTRKWAEVVFMMVAYGGAMIVWNAVGRRARGAKPAAGVWDFVSWALLGLAVGITLEFLRDAFRWPMVGVVVASLAGGMLAAVAAKERRGE